MTQFEQVHGRRSVVRALGHAAAGALACRVAKSSSLASAAPAPIPVMAERGKLSLHDTTIAERRLLALTPSWGQSAAPLAVLLHGLGETGDARMGAYAWWERYGLESSYARLFDYPVAATTKLGYFPASRIAEINANMLAEPMRPMAFLCPHVPLFRSAVERTRYAEWLMQIAIPAVRSHTGATGPLLLGGCSLGGSVALELYLLYPSAFRALALVQCALSSPAANAFAARIEAARTAAARTGSMHAAWYMSTSSADPFRLPTRALAAALAAKNVQCTAREFPGPHDQPWLREVGTLDMLQWFDRVAWGSTR